MAISSGVMADNTDSVTGKYASIPIKSIALEAHSGSRLNHPPSV